MMLLVVATDEDPSAEYHPAAAPPAASAHRLPSIAAAAMISQLAHAAGKYIVSTTW